MSTLKRWNEILSEWLDEDGVDFSLMTGLDFQYLTLYCKVRKELAKMYPKPEHLREEDDDTVNIVEARHDAKAPVFTRALTLVKKAYDRVQVLQHLATEYEKKCIRVYTHLTRNWAAHGKTFLQPGFEAHLFEVVESYFKILHKYGLTTQEDPYYFLTPQQKRKVKHEGEMLLRSTMTDASEIQVSILE